MGGFLPSLTDPGLITVALRLEAFPVSTGHQPLEALTCSTASWGSAAGKRKRGLLDGNFLVLILLLCLHQCHHLCGKNVPCILYLRKFLIVYFHVVKLFCLFLPTYQKRSFKLLFIEYSCRLTDYIVVYNIPSVSTLALLLCSNLLTMNTISDVVCKTGQELHSANSRSGVAQVTAWVVCYCRV